MTFVEVNDTQLFYEEHGSGFPLILSHGGYSDHTVWRESIPLLSQRYRVVVFDRRNCGQSSKTPNADTPDLWVQDLYQLMCLLNIQRAYMGGSSFGALTTLEFALAHPDMVEAALLFAGTTGGYQPNERYSVTFPNRQGKVGHLNMPILIVNGADDSGPTFKPSAAQQSGQDLPSSELAILYGVGHSITREAPATFINLTLGFLAKQDAKRGSG